MLAGLRGDTHALFVVHLQHRTTHVLFGGVQGKPNGKYRRLLLRPSCTFLDPPPCHPTPGSHLSHTPMPSSGKSSPAEKTHTVRHSNFTERLKHAPPKPVNYIWESRARYLRRNTVSRFPPCLDSQNSWEPSRRGSFCMAPWYGQSLPFS